MSGVCGDFATNPPGINLEIDIDTRPCLPRGPRSSPDCRGKLPAGLAALAGRFPYARNVPHLGTVRTSPSAARTRNTLVIVAWET